MEFFIWLIFCIGVGAFASKKGRSGFGWFFLSIFISPLIGGIIVACLKDLTVESKVTEVQMEQQHINDRVSYDEKLTDYRLNKLENNSNNKKLYGYDNSNTYINNEKNDENLIDDGSIKCLKCGTLNSKNSKYCKNCGSAIEEQVQMKQCPYCKEFIRADAIKCRYCKSDLEYVDNKEKDI